MSESPIESNASANDPAQPAPDPVSASPVAAPSAAVPAPAAPAKPVPTATCPKCFAGVPVGLQKGEFQANCPVCSSSLNLITFPRLHVGDEKRIKASGLLSEDGDATCVFYPELKAETVCDECGCFMSEKASVNWAGRVLCMPCLHTLRERKGDDEFLAGQKLYDNIALGLMVPWLLSIFFFFVTLFTAPVALYYVIKHRKASRGIVPRSKFRWWFALILSIALIVGWIFAIFSWITLMVEDLTN
ncbi:MAG: hypothetical protein HKN23_17785 [Verrucomicrobiales bacterium]|nr:hypothetical protein [Verrucomicrobiales bacterium]